MQNGPIVTDAITAPGAPGHPLSILILVELRFVRDALADAIERDQAFSRVFVSAALDDALAMIRNRQPDVVLLDAAFPDGISVVHRLKDTEPKIKIVVLAVTETEENIIAWAEAGVEGYVPRTAALADVVALLADITAGRQTCSGAVAAGMLRRIASGSGLRKARDNLPAAPILTALTARERQIAELIADGLSNKDIARRLNIGIATTKSHVHNLLIKSGLQRRGQLARWVAQEGGYRTQSSVPHN